MIFAIIYLIIGLILATITWCAITFRPEEIVPSYIDETGTSIETVKWGASIFMLFLYPVAIILYLWDKNK